MSRSKRRYFGSASLSTAKELISPSRAGHAANFTTVLPSAMDRLVQEGLFIRDPNEEGGFRITSKGLKTLKSLSRREASP